MKMESRKVKKPIENDDAKMIGGGYKLLRKLSRNDLLFAIGMVICISLTLIHALSAGHYANFYPINGTFQNFNPVRRLLNGQVPYKEFIDYLGLGHVFIGGILTAIFGGHYQASLIAFSFLSFFGFAMISFVVSLTVFQNKRMAIALTDILMVLLLVQPLIYTNSISGMSEIQAALNYSLGTGNSARFIRGLILPLACLGFYIERKYLHQTDERKHRFLKMAINGIIAGCCILWSNDYGISCWISIHIVSVWVAFCKERKIKTVLIHFIVSFVSSIVTVVVVGEIVTLGNLGNWLSSTFGTGGYQRWYYNSSKSFYIWDIDTSFPTLLLSGLCLLYLSKIFTNYRNNESIFKNAVLSFICMTCFCAIQEYRLLSGGDSREIAYAALFTIIISELLQLVRKYLYDRPALDKAIVLVSLIVSICWLISAGKEEVRSEISANDEGTYIESMGGNVTTLSSDLLNTDTFLNGDKFFATYASAQEVVSDVFQPSGTDYIIRVLGDDQRDKYLSSFHSEDFKYVATIKETYTDWEYWVQRANWFFYRELYSEWHPVFTNSYEVYWAKNNKEASCYKEGIKVQMESIDESTTRIIVTCEEPINGMADAYIDYQITKRGGIGGVLCFQQMVQAKNTGIIYANQGAYYESNYLRPVSAEYIPIRIVNGYGELTITSKPERHTALNINKISCDKIFTVESDYVEITHIENKDGKTTFAIPKTAKNINATKNTATIEYNDSVIAIDEVSENDNSIILKSRQLLEKTDSCNMMKIGRMEK